MRLLELRNEKGLTQRDVAKMLFISQGTYNNWENGKTQPSIEQLVMLAKIFDTTIDYIVGLDKDTNSLQRNVTTKENELLSGFNLLNKETQDSILLLIKSISKNK